MKKNSTLYTVVATFLATSVFWCLGYHLSYMNDPVVEKFASAYKLVKSEYIHEFDAEFVKDFSISAMVSALEDKYSAFYPKEYYEALEQNLTGHYYGVGIVVSPDAEKGVVTVNEVNPNGPAYKSGIKPGDALLFVEDFEVTISNYNEAVNIIKTANPEKSIKLTLKSGETGGIYSVDIMREEIIEITVDGYMIESDIAYIKISSFNNDTHKEFETKLRELGEFKALILDLRNNGGGALYSTRNIASMIMPKAVITTFEYKNGDRTNITTSGKRLWDVPVTVLVNGNSASASEVLTSALSDNKLATVVGEQTYGKAVAQQTYPFETENGKIKSAMYLTNARYLTPNGTDINQTGITPDYVIENEGDADLQLEKAVEVARKSIVEE